MTDDFDRASEREQEAREAAIDATRRAAAAIPKGKPGECDHCGEHFARLVGGLCGFCRDGRARP